ncbi:Swi SNF matrix associated, actin dependent regulator of chromatin [Desmophyllum pertusum]|uniref:Swi SNF matrix associated, actin dependent regulator of chromatin n=1 Tax=Desmophyllum pertusum TaxID=174260 RepID=A0A9W9ZXY4_9CNID|nr:Swi SNF matrix associated, actin dependent regulator of chromatin [Desmophyllum pertusum]
MFDRDEMGLGKTLQAISIAYYYRDVWPLLIVAPSSVKFSWIDEIEKWLPDVEPHNLNLIRSGSDIRHMFMIRRLKKEVLTQLPPKRRQKVIFDISESGTSQYKKELEQTMKDFKKCSAILRGDAEDPSIKSPMFEMNRLSNQLYRYTGLVKVLC